jgi:hypothetical protein
MRYAAAVPLLVLLAGCGQNPPPRKTAEAPPAKKVYPARITHFYAARPEVVRGQTVILCYGVQDAVSVRLEPPVEDVRPSYNRCFQVAPAAATTYRLIARGEDGVAAEESVTVKVSAAPKAPDPVPALITMFVTGTPEVPAGMLVTLCYGAPQAGTVTIDPPVGELKPARRSCFTVTPSRTTTYTLNASAPDGYQETAQVTVTVR